MSRITSDAAPDAVAPEQTPRTERESLYLSLGAQVVGAVYGFVLAQVTGALSLTGEDPFAMWAAVGAAVVAAVAATVGYWRSRSQPDQQWRRDLPSWLFTVNTISVVVVHVALAFLATYALYRLLALGFIGLPVVTFWAVVLMAVTLGLSAYFVYLSSSSITTQRLSTLLMAFISIGTLTATITTPDPQWWTVHFSQLGTFDDLSSWIFNGTLIAGGLLVTTFAVHISRDLRALVDAGTLVNPRVAGFVSTAFVIMGVMLAFVGIVPVDVNLLIHNLSASGMAVAYLVLLIAGYRVLRGMPRAYFVAASTFLAATAVSIVLFAVGYFSLTAFEIIVFALIFGWIAVFMRFLGVAGRRDAADPGGTA